MSSTGATSKGATSGVYLPSSRANLHPKDHLPTELSTKTFDVVCLGTGWVSRVAAARLTKAGISCLVIEEELIGGDCPFWACVPSKVLLHDDAGTQRMDVEAIFSRRDNFTGNYSDQPVLIPMMNEAGVTMARGKATLAGTKSVRITSHDGSTTDVKANIAVILGTGSEPVIPNVPGLKDAQVWTPRDATSSQRVPKHLIVIGAGAVGVEMATAYASFGSKVTLIGRAKEIIPSVDAKAGKIVRQAMQDRGVDVRVSADVSRVQRKAHDQIEVELSTGETIVGSEVLLAAGRKSTHDRLNLEAVGVPADGRWVPVDENLTVKTDDGQDWLYAGGDMTGRALLTHTSKYHGRILSNVILAREAGKKIYGDEYSPQSATADHTAVPQVVFSNPPVAAVGLDSARAKKKGITVREVSAPFVTLGGKIASDAAVEGLALWVINEENQLVGATFVGIGAADQLHASTVALVGGVKLDRLAHAIPPFPTITEVYLNLIEAAGL
ncbi:putative oxidoreductase [Myriangium duriaei CBS 260.36]|uniref:Oxidoreductase n=1 Tax=Myriangium duriaei CBS 260.36 TaxID=1168546 RepID=A0A9P4J7W7_9PEZI|nr:putative oxidoreductase [Myriangium duriaei CBS 260.36]